VTHDPSDMRHGDGLTPTDPQFLARPLDFIAQDHYRERTVCAMLDRIATPTPADPAALANALAFLRHELPLHLMDEEQDLFPLMQRRCPEEDEIDRVINRLLSDHGHAGRDTPAILDILTAVQTDRRGATGAEAQALSDYATHARRHLIVENAIILPLARARLTARDLETLHLRMRQRRGILQDGTDPNAG